jgi:hypothetical protein
MLPYLLPAEGAKIWWGGSATNSVNQSQLSYMSEESKTNFLTKLGLHNFRNVQQFLKHVTLILKGDVILRKGKMALIEFRQDS